jgi:protein phosphatase 2C family protein 2/3
MLSKEGIKELKKLKMTSATMEELDGGSYGENSDVHAGAAANVVLITKTEIYCANAGDCRAVLSKKGKAKDLSVDHKPNTPSEKARIERANGFVEDGRVNGNLALSRSIGDFEYKSNPILKPKDHIVSAYPDVSIEKLAPECEFIVVACDGIWDCMTS